MKINFKKLNENAVIPSYAKEADAGLDMTATSLKITGKYHEYGTGIALQIPEDYVGLLFPRSSISDKDLILANAVGVIDPGYRGEVKFRFKAVGYETYNVGDTVGQLIIIPRPFIELVEVSELSFSKRGKGGFGSTNK